MSDILVISSTQRIVVNPASGSISVINAGPMGPTGARGLDGAAGTEVYVGPSAPPAPFDGELWWDTDDASLAVDTIAASVLAADIAFTSKYVAGTKASGAPVGTGTAGDLYYDTSAKRTYQSDGTAWIIMSEPWQTYTPTLTSWSLGNGIIYGRSQRQFKKMFVEIDITWGSTSNFGGGANLGVGLPAKPIVERWEYGGFTYRSSSSVYAPLIQRYTAGGSTGVIVLYVMSSIGQMNNGGVTATVPHTWATGDVMHISGWYEIA